MGDGQMKLTEDFDLKKMQEQYDKNLLILQDCGVKFAYDEKGIQRANVTAPGIQSPLREIVRVESAWLPPFSHNNADKKARGEDLVEAARLIYDYRHESLGNDDNLVKHYAKSDVYERVMFWDILSKECNQDVIKGIVIALKDHLKAGLDLEAVPFPDGNEGRVTNGQIFDHYMNSTFGKCLEIVGQQPVEVTEAIVEPVFVDYVYVSSELDCFEREVQIAGVPSTETGNSNNG